MTSNRARVRRQRSVAIGIALAVATVGAVGIAVPTAATTDTDILTRYAGTGAFGTPTNGPALLSEYDGPEGLYLAADGTIYLPDGGSGTVYRIGLDGEQVRVVGTGSSGTPVPGPALSSPLGYPEDLAFDAAGNMLIADSSARRILKVTPDGTLSIYAGNGSNGSPVEGPALASPLGNVMGLAFNPAGDLVVGSTQGNRVSKIDSAQNLSFIAGNGSTGAPVAGPALNSPVSQPSRVRFDKYGNLFVTQGSANYVSKITPDGNISLFAGTGSGGAAVPGPATSSPMNFTNGLAIDDTTDEVYVSLPGSRTVVKINSSGTLSLVIGTGVDASPVYGQIAKGQPYGQPYGLGITESGVLYISSDDNFSGVDRIGASTPTKPIDASALPDDAAATVAWKPPTSWGTTTSLTGYEVKAYSNGVEVGGKSCSTTTALTCTITGLTNGVTYTFKILAKNTNGDGTSTETGPVTPSSSAPPAPSQAVTIVQSGAALGTKPNTAASIPRGDIVRCPR